MKRPLSLIAALACSSGMADEPLQLSLSQAVEMAMGRNPAAARAREQIGEFELQVREVRAEALPKLDLVSSYTLNRDPGFKNSPFFSRLVEGDDSIPPEALGAFKFDNYAYRVDLEQTLYAFGRVGSALEAARYELEGVETDARAVEVRVGLEAALGYYDLLLARKRLDVLESERRARERQLEQVQVRHELEDATRLDLLNAQVALANLRPELLAAENAVAVAEARLRESLGYKGTGAIEPIETLQLPDPLPRVPDVAELLERASEIRPELKRFVLDRKFLDAATRVRRSDTLPEITANASYGLSVFNTSNLADPDFATWNVGVFLRWTLFDGFRTSSAVGQLKSQSRQSELIEDSFRASLRRQLEEARGNWERGRAAVEVALLAVEQAREAQRVGEETFRWGASTFLDVLESERALRQAELNLALGQHVVVTSLSQLKYLVGLPADADAREMTPGTGTWRHLDDPPDDFDRALDRARPGGHRMPIGSGRRNCPP